MLNLNWYAIGSQAFTAIRRDWPISKVIELHMEGNDTPVCGDSLLDGLKSK